MCGQPCTTIKLSSSMKPDVEVFFTDPGVLLRKHQKQVLQVMDFQKNHRERLTTHNMEELVKHNSLWTKAQEIEKKAQEQERENQILKKLINQKGAAPNTPGRMSSRSSPNMSPREGSRKSPYSSLQENAGHTLCHSRKSPYFDNAGHTPSMSSQGVGNTTPSLMASRLSVRGPPQHGRIGNITGRMESPSDCSPSSQYGRASSAMNISPAPSSYQQSIHAGSRSAPLPPTHSSYRSNTPSLASHSPSSQSSRTCRKTPSQPQIQLPYSYSAIPRKAVHTTPTSRH
ncbi:probable E3 SUMO-protein ligase RNF212 [Lineus longissimus]|uniref:probable E3 SUMO-protein ligase RNF212 n=1 Tax=Lineus longissimus TaxID=88925 RepID=UPI00315CB88B